MKAFAIRGQAASMIAAPGSSMNPSRSRSRRLPPRCRQALSASSICRACAVGAAEPRSNRRRSGTVSIARTSWVAAAFIAALTEASDHLPPRRRWARFRFSRSIRAAEPFLPHSLSAAPKPRATDWFQFVIVPS